MKLYQHHIRLKEQSKVKPGNIILSQGFWNDEVLQRSVILIIEHDENGSFGIILNKESNLQVSEALPGLEDNDRLLFGGPINTKMISFVHQQKNLDKAIRITEEIYWGGNIRQMECLINSKEISPHEIKFFAGYLVWAPGMLEQEMTEKKWWVENITITEILQVKNYDLWASKLIQQENMYGVLYAVPDPCLN